MRVSRSSRGPWTYRAPMLFPSACSGSATDCAGGVEDGAAGLGVAIFPATLFLLLSAMIKSHEPSDCSKCLLHSFPLNSTTRASMDDHRHMKASANRSNSLPATETEMSDEKRKKEIKQVC